MIREENQAIFRDTMAHCREHRKLALAIQNTLTTQELILENQELDVGDKKIYNEKAKIIISKKRSFEAASAYKDMAVLVHNFASASNPGGGVKNGARAQEESLCRISTLYPCLNSKANWDNFYTPHRESGNPLHNDDCIYSPEIVVFKSDDNKPKLLAENLWFNCDVITCAAPNLRLNSNAYDEFNEAKQISDAQLKNIHLQRLRRIFEIALIKKRDCLILGAFGCGAFRNNPQVVAEAFAELLEDFMYSFKIIEFAVFCPPDDDSNYKVFSKVLNC